MEWSTIEHPRPKGLLHNPAFSQVAVARGARTIYTAGQVSVDERGALVGAGDLAAQTAQAMRNVGLALAAAGAGFGDLVKITTYVVNYKPEHRAIVSQARGSLSPTLFAPWTDPETGRGRRYRLETDTRIAGGLLEEQRICFRAGSDKAVLV